MKVRFSVKLLIATILTAGSVIRAGQTASEEGIREFTARIQNYLVIHKQASLSLPSLPPDAGPAQIVQYEQSLAREILALRPYAERGDIFTGKVRTFIANTINLKLDQNARKAILEEGNPRSDASFATISLAVNATYPATAPLSTMPPSLLAALPPLPPELELRFVGHTLILRDRKANIIVDIMTDAI